MKVANKDTYVTTAEGARVHVKNGAPLPKGATPITPADFTGSDDPAPPPTPQPFVITPRSLLLGWPATHPAPVPRTQARPGRVASDFLAPIRERRAQLHDDSEHDTPEP